MTRQVRQAVVAIYQATFPTTPDWAEGPLPLVHDNTRADTAGRSTYYPPRTARLLYGTDSQARRWHKNTDLGVGAATVLGIEALRLEDQPGAQGLVMIHLRPDDAVEVARALAGRDDTVLNGFDPGALLPGIEVSSAVPFTLAFVTPSSRRLPRLYTHPRYLRWPVTDQWLWALASRTNNSDHPPDPYEFKQHAQDRIRISADWCGMILRDGMSLVGTRTDQGAQDPYYNYAALYARSLYLDAVVLGLLQLQGITDLEESLAASLDTAPETAMDRLEKQITLFRHQLWWQHLSAHGIPNLIIAAFHRQHRLPERFDQVLAETNDFNRLARDDDSRKINNSLMLLTLLTVPVGIGLAVLQVLGKFDLRIFAIVITASLALSMFLAFTRPGRLAIRSTRRRLTP